VKVGRATVNTLFDAGRHPRFYLHVALAFLASHNQGQRSCTQWAVNLFLSIHLQNFSLRVVHWGAAVAYAPLFARGRCYGVASTRDELDAILPTAQMSTNATIAKPAILFVSISNLRCHQSPGVISLTGKLICSWCFRTCTSTTCCVVDHAKFFRALGERIRELCRQNRYSQEDMISFGFSARTSQELSWRGPLVKPTHPRSPREFW